MSNYIPYFMWMYSLTNVLNAGLVLLICVGKSGSTYRPIQQWWHYLIRIVIKPLGMRGKTNWVRRSKWNRFSIVILWDLNPVCIAGFPARRLSGRDRYWIIMSNAQCHAHRVVTVVISTNHNIVMDDCVSWSCFSYHTENFDISTSE